MKLAGLKKLPINNINYGEVLPLNKNILEKIIFLNSQVPLVYETRYLILLVKTNKNNFFCLLLSYGRNFMQLNTYFNQSVAIIKSK